MASLSPRLSSDSNRRGLSPREAVGDRQLQCNHFHDDYEVHGRDSRITFRRKMHEIDPDRLLVVAFVQDESTREVLQARSTSLLSHY